MRFFRRRSAFTYVELTLVLTIISVLAAIAVPNFLEAQVRAQVSRTYSDQALIKMATEAYRLELRAYPANAQTGHFTPGDLTCLTTPNAYLGSLPNGGYHFNQPFQYVNGLQLNPDAGLTTPDPINGPQGGAIIALLWSVGPDRFGNDPTQPGFSSPSWPQFTAATFTFTAYDPTNGTTAPGIILSRMP